MDKIFRGRVTKGIGKVQQTFLDLLRTRKVEEKVCKSAEADHKYSLLCSMHNCTSETETKPFWSATTSNYV